MPLGSVSCTACPPRCAVTVPPGPGRQPVQVRARCRPEGQAGEARRAPPAHHQARRGGPPAPEHELLRPPVGDGEPEVGREALRLAQVRLLELQPGQPGDLHQRVARATRMLAAHRAGLAVQRAMRILILSGPGRRSSAAILRDHRQPPQVSKFLHGLISLDS